MFLRTHTSEYARRLLLLNSFDIIQFQTVSFSAGASVTSITEIAISYNYEYLAMFTDTGLLWIGSADLQVGITLSHLFSPQFQLSEDEFQ